MRSRVILWSQFFVAMLIALSVLSSCAKEESINPPTSNSDLVTFTIEVPGSSQPSTRAIEEGGKHDNWIENIYLLLFEGDSFKQTVLCEDIDQTDGSRYKTVRARLPKGTFTIYALANAKEAWIANQLKVGDGKSKLSNIVESLAGFGERWSADVTSTKHRDFPMWGEADGGAITVPTDGNNKIKIPLIRTHAKINILHNTDGSNFTLESISIYNYNQKGYVVPNMAKWESEKATELLSRESKTHTPLTYDGNLIVEDNEKKLATCIDEIFIFESAVDSDTKGEWKWEANSCIVIGGTYDTGSEKKPSFYRLDFIDSNNSNIDVVRNYRYNFNIHPIKTEGYSKEEDALKNRPENVNYDVLPWEEGKVGDILVDGPYQLSISPSSVLEYSRDEEEQEVTIYTDNPKGWTLTLDDNGKPKVDYSESESKDWVTINEPYSGDYKEKVAVKIAVGENRTGGPRVAYVGLTCGLIKHRLTIKQSDKVSVSLWIEDENGDRIDAVDFASVLGEAPSESKRYTVHWTPKSAKVTVGLSALGSENLIKWDGDYKPNSATVLSSETGTYEFEVKPLALTSGDANEQGFATRYTMATYQINVDDKMLMKNLMLRQFTENVNLEIKPRYVLDGNTYTMVVYASVPWELHVSRNANKDGVRVVEKVNDAEIHAIKKDALESEYEKIGEGGFNLPFGTEVSFTTEKDFGAVEPSIIMGDFHLELTAIDKSLQDDREVLCASGIPQDGREANCYVLNPESGIGLLIPVRAANGKITDRYKTVGADGNNLYKPAGTGLTYNGVTGKKFGARLIWADEAGAGNKGVAEDGLISHIQVVGSGENGHILVMPGKVRRAGNAVVAVTADDGPTSDILWSWHIWVTEEMKFEKDEHMETRLMPGSKGAGPLSQYWLDRNLGAISDNQGAVGTMGNLYQWGRKDPLPASASVNTVLPRALYGPDKALPILSNKWGVIKHYGKTSTVATSILKPLDFYTGTAEDWCSTRIPTLWGASGATDLGKSIFDPCPAGYRVPVYGGGNKYWDKNNWVGATQGFFYNGSIYKGGYYPASGYIHIISGLHSQVGKSGLYWASSAVSTLDHARILRISATNVITDEYRSRGHGFSVRCVAE